MDGGGWEAVTEAGLKARSWSVERLGPGRMEVIRSFAPTVERPLGEGRTLLAIHGSPRSYDDFLLPTTPEGVFRALVAGSDAAVLAGGHVHRRFVRRIGEALFVNPGSVGLSYDHGQPPDDFRVDPWAAYAVVVVEGGRVDVTLRRVALDVDAVVAAICASGMPDAETWAARMRPR